MKELSKSTIFAVIDIGSCSTKLSIFDYSKNKLSLVLQNSQNCRLISKDNVVSDNCIDLLISILKIFQSLCSQHSCLQIEVCATQAIRQAKNKESICEKILAETSIKVKIISGDEEAKIIACGIKHLEKLDNFISFDVGGGSIEFNKMEGEKLQSISINIGVSNVANYVNCDVMLPVSEEKIKEMSSFIEENLKTIPFEFSASHSCQLIATGGCLTIAKQILNSNSNILQCDVLEDFMYKTFYVDFQTRILKYKVPENKADVLPVALLVALNVSKLAHSTSVRCSQSNLRYGCAVSIINAM